MNERIKKRKEREVNAIISSGETENDNVKYRSIYETGSNIARTDLTHAISLLSISHRNNETDLFRWHSRISANRHTIVSMLLLRELQTQQLFA